MTAKVGRNDPCPCGSSKKYKKCHGAANVAHNPKPVMRTGSGDDDGIVAAIENGVTSLRTEVARYSTADIVGWCKWPLADIGEQFGNKLVSQYRQLVFLLSVMIETSEPQNPPAITPAAWGRLCGHLNWLFLQYGPLGSDNASTFDESEFARSWLSKSTFLHYFNTGALATDTQLIRWMSGTLVPFDSELREICGLSATDAIQFYRALVRDMQDRDDAQYLARLQSFAKFMNITGAMMAAKYSFMRPDFSDVLDSVALHSLWKMFVVRRGELSPTTKYPTDPHHLERTPFIEVTDGVALFTAGPTVIAMADQLSAALLNSELRPRYLKSRDDFLEAEVVRVFSKFFVGTSARLFEDAHLGEFQNDLLVVDNGTVLIIEAKAGFMKEPFRDIDKAFVRLKQNFERVIGDGHQQASRTRSRLVHHEKLSFLTSRREPLVEIDGAEISEVFTICVTADDFGPLARDMSQLLNIANEEIFPWAAMFNDVETFLESFEQLGVARSGFYKFLRERASLHGRVESGDELEVAGYFLRHGTVLPLDSGPGTRSQIDPLYSDVFDALSLKNPPEL